MKIKKLAVGALMGIAAVSAWADKPLVVAQSG